MLCRSAAFGCSGAEGIRYWTGLTDSLKLRHDVRKVWRAQLIWELRTESLESEINMGVAGEEEETRIYICAKNKKRFTGRQDPQGKKSNMSKKETRQKLERPKR